MKVDQNKMHKYIIHKLLYLLGKRIYILVILFIISQNTLAKCASEIVKISGIIRNGEGALNGVTVSANYMELTKEKIQVSSETNEYGEYKIEFKFYPYSGTKRFGLGGDKCDMELKELEMNIEAVGYEKFKEVIELSNKSATYNKMLIRSN